MKRLTLGEFINKATNIHGDKYNYLLSVYVNAKTKLIVTCNTHGDFSITPNDLLSGKGCPICGEINRRNSKSNSHEDFINKSNLIHNFKYNYSKSKYNRQSDTVIIECPIHGEFSIIAKNHLSGSGCMLCGRDSISKSRSENPTGWKLSEWIKAANESVFYDSFKVYIIEVFDDNERFIKIGRTFSSVKQRFSRTGYLPYEYNIIKEISGNPYHIFKLESKLKRMCKQNKYSCRKSFNGQYECFTPDCLELLKDYINKD